MTTSDDIPLHYVHTRRHALVYNFECSTQSDVLDIEERVQQDLHAWSRDKVFVVPLSWHLLVRRSP